MPSRYVPIGLMRERLTMKAPSTSADAIGGQSDSYTTIATNVPASVEILQGSERYEAQAVKATLGFRITVRYRTDIRPKHRIEWDGTTLEVHAVINPQARNRRLVLECLETE